PSDRRDAGSRGDVLAAISAPGWVRYIVSAASDPTVASHAGADRLCGRNRRFVYDVSITNNCPSDLMSHSAEMSASRIVTPTCARSALRTLSLCINAKEISGLTLQMKVEAYENKIPH